ncbi:hypothetical protein ACFQ48_20700 [Hymenobacter caeli]|uniref:Uncharacterized protein YjeT (DUF2065 family) n=1 Tax=Hymenobacter caeli TaxID=2735894 RepID=A0ABX2FVZ5_9BACT|nr:hypothetical protein [Hymenobacter caeli]NRT21387.1 uncharacterized protein YjeT (DUF2065 family) [Hymenobacter caeli]
MYQVLLYLHSYLRYFVLGAGLVAVYRAYVGWTGHRPFAKGDNAFGASFVGFMLLQLIVGLGLYFGLSPQYGFKAMKAAGAMKDPAVRFFGMEHVALMVLAVIIAQIGRTLSKKRLDDTAKHKTAFIYYGVALALVLLMIPWGLWNPYRPLFRF